MDLPQETTSWVMLLVGMALLAAILLRNFYRYRGKLKREDRQLQQAAAARYVLGAHAHSGQEDSNAN